MNPELQQAIIERRDLGYTDEQIAVELREAGYDEVAITRVFQSVQFGGAAPTTSMPAPTTGKSIVSPWFVALAPVALLVGLVVFWGVANVVVGAPANTTLIFINETLAPLLIGACLLAFPICVVWAIVLGYRKYDGIIRCGNCGYNGAGDPARSLWAQIAAWLCVFIFWPITLVYYLATHRYRCPQCQSTFIGMRDKRGHYSAPSSGLGPAGIVLIILVVIALLGILSAVVLVTLNDARELKEQQANTTEVVPV